MTSKRFYVVSVGLLAVGSIASATDVTPPAVFVGITPCRIADTRGGTFSGQAGAPSLVANGTRTFQITGTVPGVPTQCGIPTAAVAISVNFTVTGFGGGGNLRVFPAGSAVSKTSIVNYLLETIANATLVPLGPVGGEKGIDVYAAVSATDFIADVNGYYIRPRDAACKYVNGLWWCYDSSACGQACNDVCASLGFSLTVSDATWFAAQNTAPLCQAINDAFGLGGTVNFLSYSYACLEDTVGTHAAPGGLIGPLYCSSSSGCPTSHRTTMDQLGTACGASSRRSICPCQ